ncbi:MAG: hypothetical protein KAG64_00070 [Bacteroidales bacterium]|nr:hypothetical protein [Bacteroidales bacterium]
MLRKGVISILLLFQVIILLGQDGYDTLCNINLTTISQENQGNSYITFPTDVGNIDPLWFEANLIPNFNIRATKNSRFLGVLTPQIIIRMYQEESFPVRTPSYIPQLTLYYLMSNKGRANSFSLFGRIAHHSNGQDGDFYLDNGSINTKNGSFSTNYFELGFVKTNYSRQFNAVQFLSTSLEVHPTNFSIAELDGIYGMYRWNSVLSIFKLPKETNDIRRKASLSIKLKTTYIFGDYNNEATLSWKRFIGSLMVYYHPTFLEDIGFFAQIYQGSDYYNIHFDQHLSVLRFGIMTEKIRF